MKSFFFFFSSRRRHTRWNCDWSSDVCSSDLGQAVGRGARLRRSDRHRVHRGQDGDRGGAEAARRGDHALAGGAQSRGACGRAAHDPGRDAGPGTDALQPGDRGGAIRTDRSPSTVTTERGWSMKAKKRDNGKAEGDSAEAKKKLKRKAYDKELGRLHVELVKLQEWVKYRGLKV